jgi:hypothetical protein
MVAPPPWPLGANVAQRRRPYIAQQVVPLQDLVQQDAVEEPAQAEPQQKTGQAQGGCAWRPRRRRGLHAASIEGGRRALDKASPSAASRRADRARRAGRADARARAIAAIHHRNTHSSLEQPLAAR